ncbi:hypothetical protein ES703_03472 [subsurface metagenome]
MTTTLDRFFELGEHAERMHPTALNEYQKFIDDLNQVVLLSTITDEDVKRLLSDVDNWIYLDWLKGLQKWLTKCLAGNSNKTPPVYPGELPYWSAWWIKRLLKKVGSIKRQELELAAAMEREKARAVQEEKERARYIDEMNSAIENLKKALANGKKPGFSRSLVLTKYHPDHWCELESPKRIELEEWVAPHIKKRVPQILKGVVFWDIDWWVQAVPNYAKYEVIGVPCLTWCFKIMIILEARLKLVETEKVVPGLGVAIKVDSKYLGSFYLGPVYWENQEGFTTPIALLAMLAVGKFEDDGIELIEHDASSLVFVIRGYDEGYTEIHEEFRQFIIDTAKEKDLTQGLLAKGLIDNVTAQLLIEKVDLPLPAVSAQEGNVQFMGSDDDLIASLEVMGYKVQEIKEAMEGVALSPTMPFEKKQAVVLKILDKNTP